MPFIKTFCFFFLNKRLTFCVPIKYIYVISSRCFIGKHKMPFFPFKKWLGVSYRKDTFPRKKYVRCSFKYQISNVLIWSSFICKKLFKGEKGPNLVYRNIVNGALSRVSYIFLRDALDSCRWLLKYMGNTRLVLDIALVYHARLRKCSSPKNNLSNIQHSS